MANMFNKMKTFFTGEEDDYDYDEMEDYEDDEEAEKSSANVKSFNRYTNNEKRINSGFLNINTQMGVCMINPRTLEEASEACMELKKRNVVVVNLEGVDLATSQQISDFLSGVVYALDGTMQLISNKIIIIAPVNVEMSGELKDQLQANGIKITNSFWR